MAIPKTYTLRQLRKLRTESDQVGKMYVDLFLDFIAKREREKREKTGVAEEHLFKRIKKIKRSSLDYPITVLESERDNIHGLPKSRADQLQKAIDILVSERYKLVKEEFKREEEKRKFRITPKVDKDGELIRHMTLMPGVKFEDLTPKDVMRAEESFKHFIGEKEDKKEK